MEQVEAECGACGGTGLYSGFAEPPGVAVVCLSCKGTGCQTLRYRPFKKRKEKQGIKEVHNSRGRFIVTGVGPFGKAITYREFQEGKMPK